MPLPLPFPFPGLPEEEWPPAFETEVLLLHGMSDSPYSLRALGQSLHAHNYWVLGLRLPGHGTAPTALLTVANKDLAAAVRLGVERLIARVGPRPIHIVGYSFGAALALDHVLWALAENEQAVPASLVLISPAIGVSGAAAEPRAGRRHRPMTPLLAQATQRASWAL